ncbi:MAG: hypothetical protein ACI3XQ_11580 [Eubacteriales bacterium]
MKREIYSVPSADILELTFDDVVTVSGEMEVVGNSNGMNADWSDFTPLS